MLRSTEGAEIVEYAKKRGVTRLVHFTPYMNLISIFRQEAILPVAELMNYAKSHPEEDLLGYVKCNDALRLDGRRDCINLSIETINHKLFGSFKNKLPNGDPWCILEIDAECLGARGCVFTIANAAASYVKRYGSGTGLAAFKRLYDEELRYNVSYGMVEDRRTQALPSACPTSVQAEVLYPGRIPLSAIKGLVFETADDMRRVVPALEMILGVNQLPMVTKVSPEDFKARRS